MTATSRNQSCPCGSGRKYKHCCANRTPVEPNASAAFFRTNDGKALLLPQAMQLAIQLHQAGRLRKAESIYQQVLQVQPNHADALHLLGLANHQLNQHELASTLIKKAISLKPLVA